MDLWQKILFHSVSIGQRFTSPVRHDTNGNCYLRNYNGTIFLSDHAFPKYNKYTCIHALADIQGSSYYDALTTAYAHQKYGYPLGELTKRWMVTPGEKRTITSGGADIGFEAFTIDGKYQYTRSDSDYWGPRGIRSKDLLNPRQPCYSIIHYYINGHKVWPKKYPCYALYFPETGHSKIYCPNDREHKFPASSIDANKDIWRWTADRPKPRALITKAFKDGQESSMMNINADVFAFQNERVIPKETVEYIARTYPEVVINYDNDKAGIEGATELQTHIPQANLLFYPQTIGSLQVKDTDDLVVNGMVSYAERLINEAFQSKTSR